MVTPQAISLGCHSSGHVHTVTFCITQKSGYVQRRIQRQVLKLATADSHMATTHTIVPIALETGDLGTLEQAIEFVQDLRIRISEDA